MTSVCQPARNAQHTVNKLISEVLPQNVLQVDFFDHGSALKSFDSLGPRGTGDPMLRCWGSTAWLLIQFNSYVVQSATSL